MAHSEQNLWPPTIAEWCVRRQLSCQHSYVPPKWNKLRPRSCVPDSSHRLSNTNPNQKLISTRKESDFFLSISIMFIQSKKKINERKNLQKIINFKRKYVDIFMYKCVTIARFHSIKYLLQLKHTDETAYKKRREKNRLRNGSKWKEKVKTKNNQLFVSKQTSAKTKHRVINSGITLLLKLVNAKCQLKWLKSKLNENRPKLKSVRETRARSELVTNTGWNLMGSTNLNVNHSLGPYRHLQYHPHCGVQFHWA